MTTTRWVHLTRSTTRPEDSHVLVTASSPAIVNESLALYRIDADEPVSRDDAIARVLDHIVHSGNRDSGVTTVFVIPAVAEIDETDRASQVAASIRMLDPFELDAALQEARRILEFRVATRLAEVSK